MPDLAALSPVVLLLVGVGVGLLTAFAYTLIWRVRYTRRIRQDAIQRSQATIAGLVHEQLLPYLPEFRFNPKDARFLGSPVDLVVFDGLAAGRLQRIVLVEVKTGSSTLTTRERQIRQAVLDGRVVWQELRLDPGARAPAP